MNPTGNNSRSWVSPVTAACFLILASTGLFMLFHVRIPGFHVLHEMMGILFCVAGAYHLVLNWKALLKYCRSKTGIVSLTATALIGALLLISGANHEQEEGWHGGRGPGGPASMEEP